MTFQKCNSDNPQLRVLSWGMGVQSTTLAVMSALGDLPRLSVILSTDLGWERAATYQTADFYTTWLRERGLHVEIIHTGDIREKAAKEHIHMPFWTSHGGPLQRQCTQHFKIRPIRRRIRELLGFHASKPPTPPPGAAEMWIGFSWDEMGRMKKSSVAYITNRFPLIEMRMTRQQCEEYLHARDLPIPVKTACIGCPYRTAAEYLEMPAGELAQAVSFDEANRQNPLAPRGAKKNTADQLFIYKNPRTSKPEALSTANLTAHSAIVKQRQQQLWL